MKKKYNFLDVGSRGGIGSAFPRTFDKARWVSTCFKMFDFYGIEPEQREYKRLLNTAQYQEIYDVGLSNEEGECELYVTNASLGKASVLKPDMDVLKEEYRNNVRDYSVGSTQKIKISTVDVLFKDILFDIIKVDVQGTEYEVLEGATDHLNHCSSVWVETSTAPQYKGQTLEEDIVDFLKENGFSPLIKKPHPVIPCESDIIFVKDDKDNEVIEYVYNLYGVKS